ncbi:MAG TPA: response regulator [Nitrososphaeraceae archaeon]|jgi:CheY-like chemotaxis protein
MTGNLSLSKDLSVEDNVHPRILIVDDDKDAVFFFKTCLQDNGFHVTAFNNPLKALSNYKPHHYDLLIIDIRMPRMSGFEFFEKIKMLDSDARVCFITAFEEYYDSIKEQYPNLDAKCFIKKPVSAEYLIKRVMAQIISRD